MSRTFACLDLQIVPLKRHSARPWIARIEVLSVYALQSPIESLPIKSPIYAKLDISHVVHSEEDESSRESCTTFDKNKLRFPSTLTSQEQVDGRVSVSISTELPFSDSDCIIARSWLPSSPRAICEVSARSIPRTCRGAEYLRLTSEIDNVRFQ